VSETEVMPETVDERVVWMHKNGWTVTTQSPLFSPRVASGDYAYTYGVQARAEDRKGRVIIEEADSHDNALNKLFGTLWIMANVKWIGL
jgi:hypothetical protein